jgi:hypothetical protein
MILGGVFCLHCIALRAGEVAAVVTDDAQRLRRLRRISRVRESASRESVPSRAAAEGDAPSSITRRSGCGQTRRSRHARRPANRPAAGIDAASMARRCQSPLQTLQRRICPNRQAATSAGGGEL